jgi:hypothetical protein
VAALWAAINALSTFKGEILPLLSDDWQAGLRGAFGALGVIPWWGWLIGWQTLLLAFTLEGAYRVISRMETARDGTNPDPAQEPLPVSFSLVDIAIAPYNGIMFSLSGQGLPPGIYVVARQLTLTNTSATQDVVLSVALSVAAADGRHRIHHRMSIQMPQQIPLTDVPHPVVMSAIAERQLPPLVSLRARTGDVGSVVFRLPYPGRQEAHSEAARLRTCVIELQVRDSISQRHLIIPVPQTQRRTYSSS